MVTISTIFDPRHCITGVHGMVAIFDQIVKERFSCRRLRHISTLNQIGNERNTTTQKIEIIPKYFSGVFLCN